MTTQLPNQVRIVEVGPRDGLQNEPRPVATPIKLQFIRCLIDAGLREIEATSFVHPKAVPQLADAAELAGQLPHSPTVRFSALVPNRKGLERAMEAGVKRIALFTAASETFTQKNIGMSIAESLDRYADVARVAMKNGLSVRGYVSTAFVCPYEGEIVKERVAEIAHRLLELGADEVAVSDTIGAAAPRDIDITVGYLLNSIDAPRIALHLHDTYGTALVNVYAALQIGITTFDSSAGGLGGCPFAPGAAGNLATEDLVYMLDRLGIHSGIDLLKVFEASSVIARELGRDLPGKQFQRLMASRH